MPDQTMPELVINGDRGLVIILRRFDDENIKLVVRQDGVALLTGRARKTNNPEVWELLESGFGVAN